MPEIILNYKENHYKWNEDVVVQKLEAIGNLESKKTAWIRSDLELQNSNWLTRLIWTVVAKFFHWMREQFFGVDLEMSRSFLRQIGLQIPGDGKHSKLYLKALATFSQIAPRHGFSNAIHDLSKFDKDIKASALRLIKQGMNTQDILSSMAGTKYTDEELLILVHQVKADPEKFTRPTRVKTVSAAKVEQNTTAPPETAVITVKHLEKSDPEKPKSSNEGGISKSLHFDHETIETLHELVNQGLKTQDILACMQGSKWTDKELESLIELMKANPQEFTLPIKGKTASATTSGSPSSACIEKPPSPMQTAQNTTPKVSKTIIQAEFTQFDPKFKDKGKSACTCINLAACDYLLRTMHFDEITGIGLDKTLGDGISLWEKSSIPGDAEHLEIQDVDISGLKVNIPEAYGLFAGTANQANPMNFGGAIQQALQFHQAPFAMIFTKQPETVSVTVRSPEEFWFFDPHGDPSKGRKAFVEKFSSLEAAAKALHDRFPYVDPESMDFVSEAQKMNFDYLYNGFTASIVLK